MRVLPEQPGETTYPNRQGLLHIDALDLAMNAGAQQDLICSFVNHLWICLTGTSHRSAGGCQGCPHFNFEGHPFSPG